MEEMKGITIESFKTHISKLTYNELCQYRTEFFKEMDRRYNRMLAQSNITIPSVTTGVKDSPAFSCIEKVKEVVTALKDQNGIDIQLSGRNGFAKAHFDAEKVYSLLDKLMKAEPATIEDFIEKMKYRDVILGCFISALHKNGLLGNWPKSEIAKIASKEKLVNVQQDTFKKYMSPKDNDLDDLVKEYL